MLAIVNFVRSRFFMHRVVEGTHAHTHTHTKSPIIDRAIAVERKRFKQRTSNFKIFFIAAVVAFK